MNFPETQRCCILLEIQFSWNGNFPPMLLHPHDQALPPVHLRRDPRVLSASSPDIHARATTRMKKSLVLRNTKLYGKIVSTVSEKVRHTLGLQKHNQQVHFTNPLSTQADNQVSRSTVNVQLRMSSSLRCSWPAPPSPPGPPSPGSPPTSSSPCLDLEAEKGISLFSPWR